HELRAPLTAVNGSLEGVMDGVLPASPETFQQIHAEIDRLQRVVNDLQELSRVESGAVQLELALTSPAGLIEKIQNNFSNQFSEKDIQLLADVEPGIPNILVDSDRIIQVLTNLVGNALQYSSNG